jgi:hypothetical protein
VIVVVVYTAITLIRAGYRELAARAGRPIVGAEVPKC